LSFLFILLPEISEVIQRFPAKSKAKLSGHVKPVSLPPAMYVEVLKVRASNFPLVSSIFKIEP